MLKKLTYVLVLICLVKYSSLAQANELNFEQISSIHGLSQNEVNCIHQDSNGFIWIGTLDGLNRYDGYKIVVYRNNTDDPNSLSNNYIQSLFQDNMGNFWIGTMNGLNMYDPKTDQFIRYNLQKDSVSSDVNFEIRSIIQTENGDLFLGTNHGLAVLTKENLNKQIRRFDSYFEDEINYMLEDHDGNIWLATYQGLYKLGIDDSGIPKKLFHYEHNNLNKKSIGSDDIFTLLQDRFGNLLIGTDFGIEVLSADQLNVELPTFSRIVVANNEVLVDAKIRCFLEDDQGRLYIGTRGKGLFVVDKERKDIISYQVNENNPNSLNNNSVQCLYKDRMEVLWLGTLGGGFNKVDLFQKEFQNHLIKIDGNVSSNFVRTFYEDKNENIWIGTLDDGLYKYNPTTNKYYRFRNIEVSTNEYATNAVLGKNVLSINALNDSILLVGALGINKINLKTGHVSHNLDYEHKDSLANSSIFSITKDDDGSVWIGTWRGLHQYYPSEENEKEYFVRYFYDASDANSISDNVVRYIYNDPLNSDIWIGTLNGGLNRLIRDKNNTLKFIRYQFDANDPKSISNNSINMILRSKAGILWIATSDGLNSLVPDSDKYKKEFKRYNVNDGLEGYNVKSILEDRSGNLWLGTNKGITKFNPVTKVFQNFGISDGILSEEFSEHACIMTENGKMWFGGIKGFTSFYPDSIKTNTYLPKVQFTNLFIYNEVVPVGKMQDGQVVLDKPLFEKDVLELNYKAKVFSIEFSAMHYSSPKKNKYAYKIEGVHHDWIYSNYENRRATFTNVKPGTYVLKVKASNNDGFWQNKPTSLKIKIRPPFWASYPAKTVYFLLIILIIYIISKEIKIRERLKTKVALQNIEKEKIEELHLMKLQFFTNISHEFRTPLTLILAPLENVLESLKDSDSNENQFKLMHKNAKYLLHLTQELTDFRKLESGLLKLKASKNKIVDFVQDILKNYEQILIKKSITLDFQTKIDETEIWFDTNMIIKLFNNLLFNAIKFTDEGGTISIIIESVNDEIKAKFQDEYRVEYSDLNTKEYVIIRVIDTGIGITSSSLKNIFDRFYQVDSSDSKVHLGSGIGLALAKNLILTNKGDIIVSSERNIGTEFIVCLPIGDKHLTNEEKISNEEERQFPAFEEEVFVENLIEESLDEGTDMKIDPTLMDERELILIVEDSDDMRDFVKKHLQQKYRVIEAKNGQEGYDLANQYIPDVVISDVMMPIMNGIELCEKLKTETPTSHIPVVLLTAINSVEGKITGLETGADDYISKPFNLKLLEIRIDNLLQSRKKLRKLFGKEIDIISKDFTFNTRDKEFLDKIILIIKENISEPDLTVDSLSKDMSMSRMHLFRKIKALTDQTPNEFIRIIRLKEAAGLILEDRLTISEIAYKVGFSAPSYFSTCFKNYFEMTPKEYLAKYINK